MRIIIAGLIGGLVLFVWGFAIHMSSTLNEVETKILPNEAVSLAALKANIDEPGFYFFPGIDFNKSQTAEAQNEWAEKYKTGPTGVLIYNPKGEDPFTLKKFLIEFSSDIITGLVVAFLLSMIVASLYKRVLAATLIGLTAWLSVLISYWNWYGFPTSFILAEGFDQIVGWFLAGLAIAFILRSKKLAHLEKEAVVST